MNIPPLDHACWRKLAEGVPGFKVNQLALQLLFTRMNQDRLPLTARVATLHAFFIKYERILGSELSQMKQLGLL